MPSEPAIGVKPCVVFTRSEWQDHGARRFGLAAPRAASGGGGDRVSVQPFNNAVLECLDFRLNAHQAAVMLQKARAFVEARSPVLSGPIGTTIRRIDGANFSRFSRFSSADPCTRISGGKPIGDNGVCHRLIFRIWCASG